MQAGLMATRHESATLKIPLLLLGYVVDGIEYERGGRVKDTEREREGRERVDNRHHFEIN